MYTSLAIVTILSLAAQTSSAAFNESNNLLDCVYEELEELSANCRPLKVFNGLQLAALASEEKYQLARRCACELSNLPWEQHFDDDAALRRVHNMINSLLASDKYNQLNQYPAYLWSDVDVIVKGISIHFSMRDYFRKRTLNLIPESQLLPHEVNHTAWRDIIRVCNRIALDRRHLYAYMENLQRMSPVIFYKMLDMNDLINVTYQSSKVCKLLIVENLDSFKLKPSNMDLVKANQEERLTANEEMDSLNVIQESMQADDIDSALRHASVSLMKCDHWQRDKKTLAQLGQECPMIISDQLPFEWLRRNAQKTASERTRIMLFCSCQLLLHKAKWATLLEDKNVNLMSKALTSYMNQIRFPDLQKVPIWAFHGWFEATLRRFEENRRLSIKEIIKYKHGSQDPTQAINGMTMDEHEALELLRRGCNLVVFSQGKNLKQMSEIRIIQYLDNLQYISMDPQFVFHLTLQDSNLFKLYALSKLCKPVVK